MVESWIDNIVKGIQFFLYLRWQRSLRELEVLDWGRVQSCGDSHKRREIPHLPAFKGCMDEELEDVHSVCLLLVVEYGVLDPCDDLVVGGAGCRNIAVFQFLGRKVDDVIGGT